MTRKLLTGALAAAMLTMTVTPAGAGMGGTLHRHVASIWSAALEPSRA